MSELTVPLKPKAAKRLRDAMLSFNSLLEQQAQAERLLTTTFGAICGAMDLPDDAILVRLDDDAMVLKVPEEPTGEAA